MQKLRVRDVPLRKNSESERDISKERFAAYMLHLGVELEWVKRDTAISEDGARQCVICLEHKAAVDFAKKKQPVLAGLVPACVSCRNIHGWSGYNRGKNSDAKIAQRAAK